MRKQFSIGEVSKITGFTINALRHYDKIGLVKPELVNKESNYRYYGEKQLFYFDVIRYAKHINMPLEDLKKVFDTKDMDALKDLLTTVRNQMVDEIDTLQADINNIDIISTQIATADVLVTTSDVYQREVEERSIVTSPVLSHKINNYYTKERANLELQIVSNNLTPAYEQGMLYQYTKDEEPTQIALYKTIHLDFDTDVESIMTIPEGTYLCITYSKANKEEAWAIMMDEVRELNIKSSVILDVDLMDNTFHPEQAHHELQLFIGDL
ncbi:MAG: MerR family transcriptional regulator [Erysipelotrichaceae bacterium]|nr:MerR family transcriptional regulator [Erysipelotrichaceae bacterium]